MNARNKKREEIDLPVPLQEPLTTGTCAKLVTEMIKYLLYEKEQIPVSCEQLSRIKAPAKPNDRSFLAASAVLSSMQNVSENLYSQLKLEGCHVKEIAVVLGATIVSPKLCVRITLPTQILSDNYHVEHQHSARRPLLSLMRSIFESKEFQEAMTVSLGPTNTFILIHKSDNNKISDFFLPKPRYTLPTQAANRFHIKLDHTEKALTSCSCPDLVKVYHDSADENATHNLSMISLETPAVEPCGTELAYQWYQSKEVIKGFKVVR